MSRLGAGLYLALLTVVSLPVGLLALIFAFEGWASLRSHPHNLPLALSATLFLLVAPPVLVFGWVQLVRDRLDGLLRFTLLPFAILALLWLLSLALAVLFKR